MNPDRHSESPAMAAAAKLLAEFERLLQDRADRHPVAASIPMLDGYVAAIVAGPVSIDPLDWICPLLAVDADAFNHGGTSEFTAICAVARRHNDISRVLTTTPDRFEPMHRRKPNGEVDPRPWCRGFYAAMRLRMSDWAPLLDTSDVNHALLLPILLHCRDDQGVQCSDHLGAAARLGNFCATPTAIFQPSSRPCANTGCRPATPARADCGPRGTSYRLRLKRSTDAKVRSWRVSILRQRAHYLGTVEAPDERAAGAAAQFGLDEEQRKRLAVREEE